MGFIKIGDLQPIMETFDTPNRKREFDDQGDVVYTDLNEDATILEVIKEKPEIETNTKD